MCGDYSSYVSAGSSLVGLLWQGKSQANQAAATRSGAAANAVDQRWQGKQVMAQAEQEAGDVIDQGRRIVGTQEAEQAASGVDVTSGSPLVAQDDTDKRARADALTAIYSGINSKISADSNARLTELTGINAASSASAAAIASVLQGVSTASGSLSSYKMMSAKKN